ACASIKLLLKTPWQERVKRIENQLKDELGVCTGMTNVKDVRVLGAIGVVETVQPVDVAEMQKKFVAKGVWIKPFGKLVYVMPPYIIDKGDLRQLTTAIEEVLSDAR
ncbi:MAG: aminotransferase class III-fold pyridoxal phosphate-dependent enzyme, partial [Deltaproteobacteria bacterium]|nr:aminotransferase class III-fold pyridoxal phosphate-dependent enzyme [Deltaproteobacteria bacterium]